MVELNFRIHLHKKNPSRDHVRLIRSQKSKGFFFLFFLNLAIYLTYNNFKQKLYIKEKIIYKVIVYFFDELVYRVHYIISIWMLANELALGRKHGIRVHM